MYEIDKRAVEEIKVPGIVLMENAGRGMADSVCQNFGISGKVAVICGRGNNGGDGAVAARHLKIRGSDVTLFIIGPVSASKGSAKINFEIASNVDIPVIEITAERGLDELEKALEKCDLVIDAVFGIGLKEDVSGLYADVISKINSMRTSGQAGVRYRVVSADIPSGMDPDTGETKGCAVQADLTVSFHLPKKGLLESAGASKAGKIAVADIGIPYIERGAGKAGPELADIDFIRQNIPLRKFDSNKGDYGKVAIIAGSSDLGGAAILCCRAALRTGSGLVHAFVPKKIQAQLNASDPEVIAHVGMTLAAVKNIGPDVIAAGPGLGAAGEQLVKGLLGASLKCPLVLDADGLNSISSRPKLLKKRKAPTVITPHPGEMARLLKTTAAEVQKDRVHISLKFAKEYNVMVVLKGAGTVVAAPDGKYFLNPTGNPGMAAAGMGDVLTGMIASLIGQGVKPFEASVCAAFLHGGAGDVIASLKGQKGMTASDIIEALPYVIKAVER